MSILIAEIFDDERIYACRSFRFIAPLKCSRHDAALRSARWLTFQRSRSIATPKKMSANKRSPPLYRAERKKRDDADDRMLSHCSSRRTGHEFHLPRAMHSNTATRPTAIRRCHEAIAAHLPPGVLYGLTHFLYLPMLLVSVFLNLLVTLMPCRRMCEHFARVTALDDAVYFTDEDI